MVKMMTTFYDPATIRRLAATGDHFYMGAAWILDQQDAARIDTTDYDCEWKPGVVPAPARGLTDANRATIKRLRDAANLAE